VIQDGAGGGPDGDTFYASFDFTDPVDTSTVQLETSVLVTGSVSGEIDKSFSTDGLRLFLRIPTGDCPGGFCGKSLTFKLVGKGDAPIRDTDGRILDGDYDNSDGGDYVLTQDF
jgi:hypothetical protein